MKNQGKPLLTAICLLLSLLTTSNAQNAISGQLLVQLAPEVTGHQLAEQLNNYALSAAKQSNAGKEGLSDQQFQLPQVKIVSKSLNIWLITQLYNEAETLTWLKGQPGILAAQQNHQLSQRCNLLPNDPLFQQQWQWLNDGASGGVVNADLDADEAWGLTTGGLTMAGDTIVVAVIDGGINNTHPDLTGNLWVNHAEIPNDQLDNDGNGYVDDYSGWNVFSNNDHIQGNNTMHGTPVSGIIGATGNNNTGVTGVNWKVKIMFIAGGNLESEVLAAYDYILQARRQYNASQGTRGAFVVAVNCSWGLNYGNPEDSPLWCAAFDDLGTAGILSIAATANTPVDVDLVGDLPTTCPSDYLIAVTSLNKYDQKAPEAAWGKTNIDLGAYGEEIVTTSAGQQYGVHSGTSFAAPEVAGAVALLYAAPCPELIAQAKTNPAAAAIWARNLILSSVKIKTSLQDLTVSNGCLNLAQLLQQYQDQCATCPPPFNLVASSIAPFTALLSWSIIPDIQSVALRWRKVGAPVWTLQENVSEAFQLEGLMPCTKYEFAVRGKCHSGENSEWSMPFGFVTLGCCGAPVFNCVIEPDGNSAEVVWSGLYGVSNYKVSLHPTGSSNWQEFITQDSSLFIPNLAGCTSYELLIQGWCIDSWILLGSPITFQTEGCGACLEIPYCPAGATETQEEWIASVQIGAWSFASGWGGGGYQDLTSLQISQLKIAPNSTQEVVVTPGFWGSAYKEYYRIYLDYNQDGDFDDLGELAFDPGFATEGISVGQLTAPDFAQTGATRMRVMMKYAEGGQSPPEACDTYSFGQVEDYCVQLIDPATNAPVSADSSLFLKIYPQPVTNLVWLDVPFSAYSLFDLKIWDISGRLQFEGTFHPLRNNAFYLDTTGWCTGVYFVAASAQGKVVRGKMMKL